MATPYNAGRDVTSEMKSRAGWAMLLGILTAVFGVLLIAYPMFTATTILFLACTLIVVGVVDIVLAFRSRTEGSFVLQLLLGAVFGIVGTILALFPLSRVVVLTVVLGFMLLVEAEASACGL